MKYRYTIDNGLEKIKTNTKKYVVSGVMSVGGAVAIAIPVMAAPTAGPVAGPGCFGQWRAGSVQVINGHAPGTSNTGALYFSDRAGDNSTINAANKATCADFNL
jgi:hypothetical protein